MNKLNHHSSENINNTNRMGYMPIGKLLFSMSTPMIISMLVLAMYNIIDSIFVAKIGETALTAVSLAFPIQSLMISVAAGTGVGINALLSKSLGEDNYQRANASALNGIFLAVISSLIFAFFGIFFSEAFFTAQTNNPEIIKYGSVYLKIISIFSFGIFLGITFERIMQSTGKTIYNMITQLLGAVINIALDPILIFGLFGMPKLGIAGAAIATVIGQIASMILSIIFNVFKNEDVSISFKGFKPDFGIIKQIYSVGVPSIAMQSISTFLILSLNQLLISFSETAVTILGIYFKLQSFIIMPVFGLNNGMIPIIAYNYGARNKDRIIKTVKYSIFSATIIMLIGVAIFAIYTRELLDLFDAGEHMLSMGIPAIRILSVSLSLAGANIIMVSLYQALGNGIYALYVAVLRQLVIILPLAYIFAYFMGLSFVWYSFPIAEIVSLVFNIILFRNIYSRKVCML